MRGGGGRNSRVLVLAGSSCNGLRGGLIVPGLPECGVQRILTFVWEQLGSSFYFGPRRLSWMF